MGVRRLLVSFAAAGLASSAHATWSILLVDTRTGEIALGSATCLANFDLQANTPTLLTGTGASTAQSFVDSTGANRVFIRDNLFRGTPPGNILQLLATFDGGHQTRQYGMVDAAGHAATFTGTGAGQWAGGNTGEFTYQFHGQVGTIAYAVQGNVLTGPPVVAAAVQALTTAQGDLSAKLMAAMEGARSMGGDGRCSCSPNNPQGCGSPPPNFTKSAHIGYMIVSRAGDRDGGDGVYRTGPGATQLALAGFSRHAPADIVALGPQGGVLLVNTTNQGAPFPTCTLPGATFGTSASVIIPADMNGDGWPDLVTVDSSRVGVHLNLVGRFAPRLETVIGNSLAGLAVGDINNDQTIDAVTVTSPSHNIIALRNNGAGILDSTAAGTVQGNAREIRLGRVVPGGPLGLFAIFFDTGTMQLSPNNGTGFFSVGPSVNLPALPAGFDVGDIDNDGDDDAVVIAPSTSLLVLRNTAGAFSGTTYPLPFASQKALLADVNRDGLKDIVLLAGQRFIVMLNRPGQSFDAPRAYFKGYTLSNLAAADLDGDGDPDLALTTSSSTVLLVQNLGNAAGVGAGTFNDGQGCATGSYYLDLNVAFQAAGAPDPVIQLRQQFDAWRASQVGKPDAVHSTVEFAPGVIPPGGSGTVTITLRDWQDAPVGAAANVSVTPAPGSPGLLSIGPVMPLGAGVYRATLTSGGGLGTERLRITADDGVRPVTLMPDPAISIGNPLGAKRPQTATPLP